jgi:hypothetical protein
MTFLTLIDEGLRILMLLGIYALLIGDGLILIIAGIKMLAHRNLTRTFLYMGILFFGLSLHTGFLMAAIGELPTPRPVMFRVYFFLALVALAIAVWPIVLHLLLLKSKARIIPVGTLFIGDRTNHRLHTLDCPLLLLIHDNDREYFALADMAKEMSYVTAACCRTNGNGK